MSAPTFFALDHHHSPPYQLRFRRPTQDAAQTADELATSIGDPFTARHRLHTQIPQVCRVCRVQLPHLRVVLRVTRTDDLENSWLSFPAPLPYLALPEVFIIARSYSPPPLDLTPLVIPYLHYATETTCNMATALFV